MLFPFRYTQYLILPNIYHTYAVPTLSRFGSYVATIVSYALSHHFLVFMDLMLEPFEVLSPILARLNFVVLSFYNFLLEENLIVCLFATCLLELLIIVNELLIYTVPVE